MELYSILGTQYSSLVATSLACPCLAPLMSKPLANQLTGLPTTNGNELVKSFVKSQQRNAPIYAAEGKAVQASWNNLIVAPPTTPRNPELTMNSNQDVSGFQTPVLKPRVLREESIRVDGKIERSSECAIKVSATRQRAKFPKPPRNLKSNNFSDRTCRTSKAGEKQPETSENYYSHTLPSH